MKKYRDSVKLLLVFAAEMFCCDRIENDLLKFCYTVKTRGQTFAEVLRNIAIDFALLRATEAARDVANSARLFVIEQDCHQTHRSWFCHDPSATPCLEPYTPLGWPWLSPPVPTPTWLHAANDPFSPPLGVDSKPIPRIMTHNRGDEKVLRGLGANHLNLIQLKGKKAHPLQPIYFSK